jgi:SAM-dependent MidA family methyltransferase
MSSCESLSENSLDGKVVVLRVTDATAHYGTTIRAMSLPEPSADALAASRALQQVIREDIRANGSWISFSRYMELALYAPGLGYYAGGSAKLGKDGDFTTAPEITPLFGATLAEFAAEIAGAEPVRILEFGAGTGKLARDILDASARRGTPVASYAIVELSAELRQRQQEALAAHPTVTWLDTPPVAFSGLVIANEVLDAMPVPLLVRQGGHWLIRGVTLEGEGFAFADRAGGDPLAGQVPDAEALPEGYLTEVHPQQAGFVRMLADMLRAGEGGAALLIDYGFPAHEYYLPQRMQGTLMCHYRHHAHGDPFFLPGLQDITAHVDFTDIARAGIGAGLDLQAYMSQAAFLLSAGLPSLLGREPVEDPVRWLPLANAVQKLTSPAEMGELFKVLVLTHDLTLPEKYLQQDRSHRL